MIRKCISACGLSLLLLGFFLPCVSPGEPDTAQASRVMQKRWLFVWRNMSDPKEVDRMIEDNLLLSLFVMKCRQLVCSFEGIKLY